MCLAAVTLLVSMLVAEAKTALLLMLGIWVVVVIGLPRLSASIAEQVYPSPNADTFWEESQASLQANRPQSGSDEYLAVEREVLEQALGRAVQDSEYDDLPINRDALRLQVSEVIDAEAYDVAFAQLFENYEKQRNLRRLLAIFTPTIALQYLSHSFSGTDVSAHEHFSIEAERQRNVIVRALNEDMLLNGAGQSFGYLAPPEFWDSVPLFEYQPPSVATAWREGAWDLMILLFWGLAGTAAMFWFARNRIRV